MPIAGEKGVDVAAIPSFLLGGEDGANGGAISLAVRGIVGGTSGWRCGAQSQYQKSGKLRSSLEVAGIGHVFTWRLRGAG